MKNFVFITSLILLLAISLQYGCSQSGNISTTTTTTIGIHDVTIPVQQSTYADENQPSTVCYAAPIHYSGYWDFFGGYSTSGYIQFDVAIIPATANILSANLNLYILQVPGVNTTIYFYNLASSWNETNLSFNFNRPSISGSSIAAKVFSTTDSGWISIDITDCVKQWVNGSVTNNGLNLASLNTTQWNAIMYYSKASSVNQPKLEVTYQ